MIYCYLSFAEIMLSFFIYSQAQTDPVAAAAAAGDDPAAAMAAAHAAAAAATAAAMKEVELPANLEEDLVSPYDDGISGNPVGELQEVCMNRRMQPPVYEVGTKLCLVGSNVLVMDGIALFR